MVKLTVATWNLWGTNVPGTYWRDRGVARGAVAGRLHEPGTGLDETGVLEQHGRAVVVLARVQAQDGRHPLRVLVHHHLLPGPGEDLGGGNETSTVIPVPFTAEDLQAAMVAGMPAITGEGTAVWPIHGATAKRSVVVTKDTIAP